ncbi:hypothetical protein GCM10010214_19460 [Streptomyces abikoensis]|nr:hypothetical protein GCM10010214_19460 [Streptomyces abikoensis]
MTSWSWPAAPASPPGGAAAAAPGRTGHPSDGGLSAVIRYTEYGVPHIVGKDYANVAFGSGWAQARREAPRPARPEPRPP